MERRAAEALLALERPSQRRVVIATGVVLHTNLGRAPLGRIDALRGYSNLEYDLATGRRRSRDRHVSTLFEPLLGACAIAVNNNAAALFLALNELAAGGEAPGEANRGADSEASSATRPSGTGDRSSRPRGLRSG